MSELNGQERSVIQRIIGRINRDLDYRAVRTLNLGQYQQKVYLKKLFRILEIDTVLDVGGNEGQYANFIRKKVGFSGKIVTFEPIPDAAERMKKKAMSDDKWFIVPNAIGSFSGIEKFNISKSSQLSSLLKPDNTISGRLNNENVVSETIDVQVDTIENILLHSDYCRDAKNVYLKLDVQGYEKECLKGVGLSLQKIPAMQMEMSVIPLYQGGPTYLELMEMADQMGYNLSLIPAHNSAHFPDIIDFDCHFISRAVLGNMGLLKG